MQLFFWIVHILGPFPASTNYFRERCKYIHVSSDSAVLALTLPEIIAEIQKLRAIG